MPVPPSRFDADEDDLPAPRARSRAAASAAAPRALRADADWDADDAPPDREYRRPARRARVRRRLGAALASRAVRALRRGWPALVAGLALALGYHAATTSPRFALASSADIRLQFAGAAAAAHQVTRAQVLPVFAADIGRNIFFIPLAARADALPQIPWVRRAAVLRVWPDQIVVKIEERRPVAFARVGHRLRLVDADGFLLPRPAGGRYDFAVLTGLAGTPGGPPAAADAAAADRAPQLQRFLALRDALAAAGGLGDFSEIDLADPENIVATLAGNDGAAPLRLSLGDQDFARRYNLYRAHIAEWRRDYPRLRAVDLRYPGQAILDSAPASAPISRPKAAVSRPKAPVARSQAARSRR